MPFQGVPFRALFVYHVRMLRHLLFGQKPRRDFLYSERPTFQENHFFKAALASSMSSLADFEPTMV